MVTNTRTPEDLFIVTRDTLDCGKEGMAILTDSKGALIKNFATHPVLEKFFRENPGVLSVQWVKLETGDKIESHEHDVDTLLISCMGECLVIGEAQRVLRNGDVAFIPKHVKHGLTTHGQKSFWGLSLRLGSP